MFLSLVIDLTHTVLGIRKPENRFQKLRKNDITIAAIWWFGVRATVIIPYNVK
jgi:hypothetical protein